MTIARCSKCGRRLKRPSASGYGPVCARAVLGVKPKREKVRPQRDDRTPDLFAREKDIATAVHGFIKDVSLEMPS